VSSLEVAYVWHALGYSTSRSIGQISMHCAAALEIMPHQPEVKCVKDLSEGALCVEAQDHFFAGALDQFEEAVFRVATGENE